MYVIITACSAGKDDSTPIPQDSKIIEPSYYLNHQNLITMLEKIRKKILVSPKSHEEQRNTYAFDLYTRAGKAYKDLYWNNYNELRTSLLEDNTIEWFFLSGGYGIVHALEKARKYQATFNRSIAQQKDIPYTTELWNGTLISICDAVLKKFQPEWTYIFGSRDYTQFIKMTDYWKTSNNVKMFESTGQAGPSWLSPLLNRLVSSILSGKINGFNAIHPKFAKQKIKSKPLENGKTLEPTIDREWINRFRNIILRYNEQRISDPFMSWFRRQNEKGAFANNFERVLMILIDARFDQQTKAESALENTKQVFKAGILKRQLKRVEIPPLAPRRFMTSEEWTDHFHNAVPKLYRLAEKITQKGEWHAEELLNLMQSANHKVPYLGTKTSRLAVRWLHELVSDLKIDMSDFNIPIDVLVYRVASRLGIIDPHVDKYFGKESPADLKIQAFAKAVFPDNPWFLDEPLWSSGRQPSNGGHCFPKYPNHNGCIFEKICPRRYTNFDPSGIGMQSDLMTRCRTATSLKQKTKGKELTDKQKQFSEFVQKLKAQGITGEEYRRKIAEWSKTNP